MKDNALTAIQESLHEFARFPLLRRKLAALKLSRDPYLLAIGKTAWPMTQACLEALQERGLRTEGYLLTKYGHRGSELPGIKQLEAGHPVPDQNGLKHSKMILSWLSKLDLERTLIVLISGGSSALFEVPLGGKDLKAIVGLNSTLLNSGLGICEMNLQRTSISLVKGGRALMQTNCRIVQVFGLSDVADNDPRVIGSGSFFEPHSKQISDNKYKYLYSRNKSCYYTLIGDNLSLLKLIFKKLKKPIVLEQNYQKTSVEKLVEKLATLAKEANGKTTYLFGGEAPVKVTGIGLGGRCTHLALLFARQIAGLEGIQLTAVASDGNDNLDGVSGAMVDGSTWQKLICLGFDPEKELKNCNSYPVLLAADCIIPAWQHPVNVNDIYILETGITKK